MRKGVLILSILLFVAGGISVVALLAAKDQSVNQLTLGNNTIEVVETFAPPKNIVPGDNILKNVKVKNTKGVECYVRIRPVFSDESLLSYLDIDYQEQWIYSAEDDFYYYPFALKEGQESLPLFTQVYIKENVSVEQASKIEALSIYVYAESCQKGNAKDYISAWREMEKNCRKE